MVSLRTQLVAALWAGSAVASYNIIPDRHTTWKNTRIPSLINLSEDQNSGSYWTSAFATATTGQQFLLIHHQYAIYCKSSIFDLETLEYWKYSEQCTPTAETKTVTSDSVSLEFSNFTFKSAAADKISELELTAKSPEYSFKLGVESKTSKVVLNGGNGVIAWGPNGANSTHWSIPAARTTGSITIGDEALEIDPARSLTWYDHQITSGAPDNFTFFGLHFPNPNVRVSIWAYDRPDSNEEFRYATVRLGEETQMVLPYTWEVDWDSAWTSPTSNHTYPQAWTLKFENGDYLKIKSVKGDQEIMAGSWTGFVTVERSRFFGQTRGYGVGDVIFAI